MERITYVYMYVPALIESLSALNLKVWHFKKIITSEIKKYYKYAHCINTLWSCCILAMISRVSIVLLVNSKSSKINGCARVFPPSTLQPQSTQL